MSVSVKQTQQKQARSRQFGGKTRTSWKPGQSGNPNGRPKMGESWKEILTKIAYEVPDITHKDGAKNRKTYIELAALRLWQEAMKGNIAAFKEIGDRMDGKPRQQVEVHTPEVVHWEDLEAEREKQRAEMEEKRPKTAKEAKAMAEAAIAKKQKAGLL